MAPEDVPTPLDVLPLVVCLLLLVFLLLLVLLLLEEEECRDTG